MSQTHGLFTAKATATAGARLIARPPERARADAAATLVPTSLSLNLILLAFFVVLNGASQFDQDRVAAVLDGVKSTFGLVVPAQVSAGSDAAGRAVARDALRDSVSAAFATVLPGRELVLATRVDRIDVVVPQAALFDDETGALRPAMPLLGRLVDVIINPARGVRYEMIVSADLRTDRASMSAAAGALVNTLVMRGIPPNLISAGRTAGTKTGSGVGDGTFEFSFLVLDAADPLPISVLVERGAS